MSKAKGEYIALLDADDIWEKNKLQTVIDVFNKKEPDWIYSDAIEFYENNKENVKKLLSTNNILSSLLLWDGKVLTAPSGIVFKRECLNSDIKFDKNFSTAADQDFTIQLAFKCKGYHIDKPLWRYRVLKNSMSRNIAVMEKDHIGVYKKSERNRMFKSWMFKRKCFSNLYWILAGSWWKDGRNKKRGIYFIFKALVANPFSIYKIVKKVIK